jgi:UDP-4-amino-4,6-dideoxy-N-acetyl-beta-L-altrosamine transaminase
MIPYARQSIDEADVARVVDVLRSDFLTQGPLVPEFERIVAQRSGARFAVATCNATAALHLACKALGAGPGDLVWTSPNSFVASANCARYCGADVDFVDIEPATYNISVDALAEKLEEAERNGRLPKIVVVVDFAGQPCDLAPIAELKTRYGFAVVEDASHAVGASYCGEPVGSGRYADVTVFSFHPVKIVTTAEGGMALTNDATLAAKMQLLRGHGVTRERELMESDDCEPWEYEQVDLGFNYRITEIQAALGSSQMSRLDEFLRRRREIAARYDHELAGLPLTLPFQHPQAKSAYHLYPVRVRANARGIDRRRVYDELCARGVRPNVHYIPIHTQPYYRRLGFAPGDFPTAEAYYREALSLPMYFDLSDSEQGLVIQSLRAIFGGTP